MNQTSKVVDQPERQKASSLRGALTITEVLADGLDALVDGRGWNQTHEEARLLANAAPELLSLAKLVLKEWEAPTDGVERGELIARLSQYSIEARAAVRKATLRPEPEPLFKITRFFASGLREHIASGLTLEEAKAYCKDPETSSSTCETPEAQAITKMHGAWFDGFDKERA